jgi:hypothetical protein
MSSDLEAIEAEGRSPRMLFLRLPLISTTHHLQVTLGSRLTVPRRREHLRVSGTQFFGPLFWILRGGI